MFRWNQIPTGGLDARAPDRNQVHLRKTAAILETNIKKLQDFSYTIYR